jgi:hypothetical protein
MIRSPSQELKATIIELLFQVKDIDSVTLEDAIELLQYPKILVCISLYFKLVFFVELGPA